MITFIVGLAILVVVIAIIAAIGFFVSTAMVLLPWTIPATGLGAMAGYAVGLKAPMSDGSRRLVGAFIALIAVMGLGYVGLAIVPPKVPPVVAQRDPLELFPMNEQSVSEMTPIHMGVSALIGAVGVAIALGSTKKEKRLVLEVDEDLP